MVIEEVVGAVVKVVAEVVVGLFCPWVLVKGRG